MTGKYTLESVEELIRIGAVNMNNLGKIMESLRDYEFNPKIRNIFLSLSNNPDLPNDIRINFRKAVNDFSMIENSNNIANTRVKHPPRVGYQGDGSTISLENDSMLGKVTSYASSMGIKIVSKDPGIVNYPEISFELDENSKPYIDNILLTMYDNKDGIDVSLTRVSSTGKELLTLKVEDPSLGQIGLQQKGKEMFARVEKILKSTSKEKDYERDMPPKLKELKDRFHNDDPKIPNEDFKIGYSRKNGENTYYIIADSKEQAIELAEEMGYEIEKDRGGNVFELDTDGKDIEGSKLDVASENVNEIDEVKETENGISDVDINYNNKHYGDEEYEEIKDFIDNSVDPDTMSVVQIDVPSSTPNQRVVNLASEDGTRKTIIFNNGKDFDNYTLPKIVESYGNGTSINRENTTKTEYGNGKAGYDVLSNNNNYLRMNNFDSEVVERVNNSLSNYMVKEESSNIDNTKTNSYAKKLGTYPTTNNNSEAANASFTVLTVFISVLTLGFGIIYLIFGG